MAHTRLDAHRRTEFGNGPTRRLRRQGLVPGVVYQPGSDSLHVAFPDRELRRALHDGGRTSVIDLSIAGAAPRPVLFKDWQLDPVRGEVVHIDFQQVDLTQEIEAPVAIVLTGDPVGVRDGGILDQTLREVTVSALPDSLPDAIEIDVAALTVGDSISVADLVAPPGVTITSDLELGVASVVAPTVATDGDDGDDVAAEGGDEQPGE